MEKDSETIRNYSNPAYVLGWPPEMAPVILSQPESSVVIIGQSATLSVKAAGIPDVTYQWFRDDIMITGATSASLALANVKKGDAGHYRVTITNSAGTSRSADARLSVK